MHVNCTERAMLMNELSEWGRCEAKCSDLPFDSCESELDFRTGAKWLMELEGNWMGSGFSGVRVHSMKWNIWMNFKRNLKESFRISSVPYLIDPYVVYFFVHSKWFLKRILTVETVVETIFLFTHLKKWKIRKQFKRIPKRHHDDS